MTTRTSSFFSAVRNASSSPLQGPLFLALSSAPVGVTLDNALAEGSKAGPYVPIPLGSELLPGQFTLVPVKLRALNGNVKAAGWTVFSGEPE